MLEFPQDNIGETTIITGETHDNYEEISSYGIFIERAQNVVTEISCLASTLYIQKQHPGINNIGKWSILSYITLFMAYASAEQNQGWTLLHDIAMGKPHDEELAPLAQSIDIDTQTNSGATALYIAAKHNNIDALEKLLMLGANSNIRDSNGYLPLHIACYYGSYEAIKVLYSHGVSLHAENIYHQTCSSIAQMAKKEGVLSDIRLEDILGFISLHTSINNIAEASNMDMVPQDTPREEQDIVTNREELNMMNQEFLDALNNFIYHPSPIMFNLLQNKIKLHSFDPNLPNNDGEYLLEHLIRYEKLNDMIQPLMEFLLKQGANPHLHKGDHRLSKVALYDYSNIKIANLLHEAEALYGDLIFLPHQGQEFSLLNAYSLTKMIEIADSSSRAVQYYSKLWVLRVKALDMEGIRTTIFDNHERIFIVFHDDTDEDNNNISSQGIIRDLGSGRIMLIHENFLKIIEAVWPSIEQLLKTEYEGACHKEIVFTGHSMGGALSSIAAVKFASQCMLSTALPKIYLYTFGSFIPGDNNFAEVIMSVTNGCAYNIMNACDPMAILPYAEFSVKPIGQVWYFDQYKHLDTNQINPKITDYKGNEGLITVTTNSPINSKVNAIGALKSDDYIIERTSDGEFRWPGCSTTIKELNITTHSLSAYRENLKLALVDTSLKEQNIIQHSKLNFQLSQHFENKTSIISEGIDLVYQVVENIYQHKATVALGSVVTTLMCLQKCIRGIISIYAPIKYIGSYMMDLGVFIKNKVTAKLYGP